MYALVLVPHDLPMWDLDGRTVVDRLLDVAREAGWEAEAVPPEHPLAAGPGVVIDGRYAALGPISVSRLAERAAAHPVLRTSAGHAVAAVLPADAHGTAGEALELARGPTVALWDDGEATEVYDAWSFAQAAKVVRTRRVRALAERGVRFIDPERVVVEHDVEIAEGVTVWPDVVLRGATRIARGAELQSGCWLVDSHGAACSVGPMAHLRPGAVLHTDVKVGNYVEVKASVLHEGVRASHLTYIGDATVGARTNIGAGTITCNYDGFRKHRTTIGEGVFIGSNTSLVAPVTVGDGAVTGASSAISRDVPAGALAVERAEVRMLPGKGSLLMERNHRLARQPKPAPKDPAGRG